MNTLHTYNITPIVHVCEPNYEYSALELRGFIHSEWYLKYFESPLVDFMDNWLILLDDIFELNLHYRCYTSAYTPHFTST